MCKHLFFIYKMKKSYTTLPTGKIIDNIYNIKTISNISTNIDKYATPMKEWFEYDIEYDDRKITLSYETLGAAQKDREYIETNFKHK